MSIIDVATVVVSFIVIIVNYFTLEAFEITCVIVKKCYRDNQTDKI
jgi:hypothetical protein